jgi:hypothetical protein
MSEMGLGRVKTIWREGCTGATGDHRKARWTAVLMKLSAGQARVITVRTVSAVLVLWKALEGARTMP